MSAPRCFPWVNHRRGERKSGCTSGLLQFQRQCLLRPTIFGGVPLRITPFPLAGLWRWRKRRFKHCFRIGTRVLMQQLRTQLPHPTQDPSIIKALLVSRAFNLLKHQYELHTSGQEIGNLDCDPWINAQDGEIVEPFRFITVRNHDLEAVIRLDYVFEFAPKRSRPQSVIIKFQCSRSGSRWQLSDFIMPNNESLLDLLERKP